MFTKIRRYFSKSTTASPRLTMEMVLAAHRAEMDRIFDENRRKFHTAIVNTENAVAESKARRENES